MEDDDGEGSNTESQVLTDSESLKIHRNFSPSFYDEKEEEEKGVECDDDDDEEEEEIYPENFPTRLPNPVSHPVFKGFKKRILESPEPSSEPPSDDSRGHNSRRGKITEYAQYLGLQPAAKYTKCSKCTNHRNQGRDECSCQAPVSLTIPETPPAPPPSENIPSTSKLANNFRITRKVYLCAACGTYFENWNLFLHMREIHKRHICLFCLGMFGQAERLSHHLENKHNVTETPFTSVEDFYNAFKGSCYLICCSCEKVFSETDNFYNHYCPSPSEDTSLEEEEVCSVCRQSGQHTPGCQRQVENTPVKTGGKSTKGIIPRTKNNRIKRSEKHMLTSYQKKLTQLYERKMTMRTERMSRDSAPSESKIPSDCCTPEVAQSVEKPVEENLPKDTVSETISEVSTAIEETAETLRPSPEVAVVSGDKLEDADGDNRGDTRTSRDTVTETIMRVSRLDNSDSSEQLGVENVSECERLTEQVVEDYNEAEAPQDNDKREDSSSEADDYNYDESLKKLESTPMSVSRVNRTKGSLVIKICTNKNSYSVSTPNMNGVDESEDNNNESDSDNDRLTVALEESQRLEPPEDSGDKSPLREPEADNSGIATTTETPENDDEKFTSPEQSSGDNIQLAGEDVPPIDLNVNGLLESVQVVELLKGCIEAASSTCVYCNHARHIAVNGRQLALHMLAEHRFQPQHPAIIIQPEQFVNRMKKSLDDLDGHYLNADSYDSQIGTYNVPTIRTYECFNCRVVSHIHKDLYLHNRKMHQKAILICIMCKSTFYNYSELLCHLCPGIYSTTETDMSTQSLTSSIANPSIKYRCCICTTDPLPSAFRLMVHLRKRHHACDVCLELNGNQQKLSNHVWKHKLQHLCYRCGIAYRNKPDITKHLFWKHGTESVLCKKCLQKKWPHIYHFCIPPSAFVCEECNLSFSRAVALKVHKRLHSKEEPYGCEDCKERFISRKLLARHEVEVHRPPEPQENLQSQGNDCGGNGEPNGMEESPENLQKPIEGSGDEIQALAGQSHAPGVSPTGVSESQVEPQKAIESVRKVVDVYDLPPLNLSSDSDSDDEDNAKSSVGKTEDEKEERKEEMDEKDSPGDQSDFKHGENEEPAPVDDPVSVNTGSEPIDEHQEQQVDIMNGIWDNFKSYATTTETNLEELAKSEEKIIEAKQRELLGIITADHDYCVVYGDSKMEEEPEVTDNSAKPVDLGENGVNLTEGVNENDQAFLTEVTINEVNEVSIPVVESEVESKDKSPKKKTNTNSSSSDSSSDSDSSSCSCGTNCSCSSSSSDSSSSSSSSSDSDSSGSESSPKKQPETRKRERKRGKSQHKRTKESVEKEEIVNEVNPIEEMINVHTIEEPVDVQEQSEAPGYPVAVPPVDKPNVMRESDLETDETETDEDFYDEHPQELANKLLAEKRNQLMLLASVATPESSASTTLRNGSLDDALDLQSQTSGKKKIKVKKRKKTESRRGARGARGARGTRGRRQKYPGVTAGEPPIKINIPKPMNRQKHSKIRLSSMVPPVNPVQSEYSVNNSTGPSQASGYSGASGASGTETPGSESKRSSKRKRIPKKFYGDSSDDEQHNQYPKWRRIDSNSGVMQGTQGHQYVPTITIKQNFGPPLQSK
ncbi:uncharacterized protein MESR4 isoform X2 [Fopius arisanus]|nr:PREDICTED: uncharacterized protein LOC105271882 isoform X2 [Fopius arisanus]